MYKIFIHLLKVTASLRLFKRCIFKRKKHAFLRWKVILHTRLIIQELRFNWVLNSPPRSTAIIECDDKSMQGKFSNYSPKMCRLFCTFWQRMLHRQWHMGWWRSAMVPSSQTFHFVSWQKVKWILAHKDTSNGIIINLFKTFCHLLSLSDIRWWFLEACESHKQMSCWCKTRTEPAYGETGAGPQR